MAVMKVLRAKGKKPISFRPGGLHKSLGVPQGKPIPKGKMAGALAGTYGAKAKRQAQFAKNVLTGPKRKAKPMATKKSRVPRRPRSPRPKGY